MRQMDLAQKVFYFLGSIIAASFLIVIFFVLGTSEDGMLTVDGMSHLSEKMTSFYHFVKWFVLIWAISAVIMLIRMIRGR